MTPTIRRCVVNCSTVYRLAFWVGKKLLVQDGGGEFTEDDPELWPEAKPEIVSTNPEWRAWVEDWDSDAAKALAKANQQTIAEQAAELTDEKNNYLYYRRQVENALGISESAPYSPGVSISNLTAQLAAAEKRVERAEALLREASVHVSPFVKERIDQFLAEGKPCE